MSMQAIMEDEARMSWGGLLLQVSELATAANSMFRQFAGIIQDIEQRSSQAALRLSRLQERVDSLERESSAQCPERRALPRPISKAAQLRCPSWAGEGVELHLLCPASRPLALAAQYRKADSIGARQTASWTQTNSPSSTPLASPSPHRDSGIYEAVKVTVDTSGRPLHRLAATRKSYLYSAAATPPSPPTPPRRNRRPPRRNTVAISSVAERDGLRAPAEPLVEEEAGELGPLRRLRRSISLRRRRSHNHLRTEGLCGQRSRWEAVKGCGRSKLPIAANSKVMHLASSIRLSSSGHSRKGRGFMTSATRLTRTFSIKSLDHDNGVGGSYRAGYRLDLSWESLSASPSPPLATADSLFSCDQEGYYTSMHRDCGLEPHSGRIGSADSGAGDLNAARRNQEQTPADDASNELLDEWLLEKFKSEMRMEETVVAE